MTSTLGWQFLYPQPSLHSPGCIPIWTVSKFNFFACLNLSNILSHTPFRFLDHTCPSYGPVWVIKFCLIYLFPHCFTHCILQNISGCWNRINLLFNVTGSTSTKQAIGLMNEQCHPGLRIVLFLEWVICTKVHHSGMVCGKGCINVVGQNEMLIFIPRTRLHPGTFKDGNQE